MYYLYSYCTYCHDYYCHDYYCYYYTIYDFMMRTYNNAVRTYRPNTYSNRSTLYSSEQEDEKILKYILLKGLKTRKRKRNDDWEPELVGCVDIRSKKHWKIFKDVIEKVLIEPDFTGLLFNRDIEKTKGYKCLK